MRRFAMLQRQKLVNDRGLADLFAVGLHHANRDSQAAQRRFVRGRRVSFRHVVDQSVEERIIAGERRGCGR